MFTKFSVEIPEYFIYKLLRYENLVVFDATSFSAVFPEKESILEDNTILICFVVFVSSFRC